MKYRIICLDWWGEPRIQELEFSNDAKALAYFENLLAKNPSREGPSSFTDWKLQRIDTEEESTTLSFSK